MNKNIVNKLKTIQGYFLLTSLEARINYSSKLVGFDGESDGYIKSNLNLKSSENIWARGVFFHEIAHYYQNTMTPIGVFIRLTIVAKTFLTFNFMANEGLKRDGEAIVNLNSDSTLYKNFMIYSNTMDNLQKLIFGIENFTQKEALNILSNGLGICNTLGSNAPNYFSFLKIDKALNYTYEEDSLAIPPTQNPSQLFGITLLFEGWSACVQIVEYIHNLYFDEDKLNTNIKDIVEKVFHSEYTFVPESVALNLYDKKLIELNSEELFIVVNLTKILAELSFYSPIHPSFVELNSNEIAWIDIYPSWRFLKALSVIKDINLFGIGNYQESYNEIVKIICDKFNWSHPEKFSTHWENLKSTINLNSVNGGIIETSLSQIKILQAYDASISIKKELGIDIFSLYPEKAEQLTQPRIGNESLLIPPLVLFEDREMVDSDNFVAIFFQYMFTEYVSSRFYGYDFKPKEIVEDYFVNDELSNESKILIEELIKNIDNLIDDILR